MYEELQEVALRPKFKKYFSFTDLESLLSEIREKSRLVVISSDIQICRDPKDNFLLSLATDGKATHLITGDKDLLVIKKFGTTTILSIAEFLLENSIEFT